MSTEFKIFPYVNQVIRRTIAEELDPNKLQTNINELCRNGATRLTIEDRLLALITAKIENTVNLNNAATQVLKQKSINLKEYSGTDIVNAVVDKSDEIEALFSQTISKQDYSLYSLFKWAVS